MVLTFNESFCKNAAFVFKRAKDISNPNCLHIIDRFTTTWTHEHHARTFSIASITLDNLLTALRTSKHYSCKLMQAGICLTRGYCIFTCTVSIAHKMKCNEPGTIPRNSNFWSFSELWMVQFHITGILGCLYLNISIVHIISPSSGMTKWRRAKHTRLEKVQDETPEAEKRSIKLQTGVANAFVWSCGEGFSSSQRANLILLWFAGLY